MSINNSQTQITDESPATTQVRNDPRSFLLPIGKSIALLVMNTLSTLALTYMALYIENTAITAALIVLLAGVVTGLCWYTAPYFVNTSIVAPLVLVRDLGRQITTAVTETWNQYENQRLVHRNVESITSKVQFPGGRRLIRRLTEPVVAKWERRQNRRL